MAAIWSIECRAFSVARRQKAIQKSPENSFPLEANIGRRSPFNHNHERFAKTFFAECEKTTRQMYCTYVILCMYTFVHYHEFRINRTVERPSLPTGRSQHETEHTRCRSRTGRIRDQAEKDTHRNRGADTHRVPPDAHRSSK